MEDNGVKVLETTTVDMARTGAAVAEVTTRTTTVEGGGDGNAAVVGDAIEAVTAAGGDQSEIEDARQAAISGSPATTLSAFASADGDTSTAGTGPSAPGDNS
jgi:hypothetical protein